MMHKGAVVEKGTHDELMDLRDAITLFTPAGGQLINEIEETYEACQQAQDAIEEKVQINTDSELAQPSRFWIRATTWALIGTTCLYHMARYSRDRRNSSSQGKTGTSGGGKACAGSNGGSSRGNSGERR